MIKQAGKLTVEDSGKSPRSEDNDKPHRLNSGGQKPFPSKVKTVNMIYATRIPKKERKRALHDIYFIELVAPKFNPLSACPIMFDRKDHPT